VLKQLTLPSTAALQSALDEFGGFYNHVRVHQGLHGLTPAQAWRGLSHLDLQHAKPGCSVQAFDGLLLGYHARC
jgi:putative transposase